MMINNNRIENIALFFSVLFFSRVTIDLRQCIVCPVIVTEILQQI
jgi:hypothetical protein